MSFSKTTGFLSGRGETTVFAVLVSRVTDPLNARVTSDGLVEGINKDDFVVLIGTVLVNPV